MDTCGHFPWIPAIIGMRSIAQELAIGATLCQFFRQRLTNHQITCKYWSTCPFVLAATAASSAGLSAAISSLAPVLEICAPMLLAQQRNPTDQMNEQRPQASFQNSSEILNSPFVKSFGRNFEPVAPHLKYTESKKAARFNSRNKKSSNLFPEENLKMEKLPLLQMRCGVQRPSPLMNGHSRVWRHSNPRSTNEKS